MKPDPQTYPEWYRGYVELVEESTVPEALRGAREMRKKVLNYWPKPRTLHRYESGKWSVQEVVQHLIDTERIFTYRALSIARGASENLLGYDHDAYVATCNADARSFESLLAEVRIVRKGTLALFESFSAEQMKQEGSANGVRFTTEQLGFIIAGHERHHLGVLKRKYL
jgi:hypothetical protein